MTFISGKISAFKPENAPKPSRACASTGQPFSPGDKIYSVLLEEDGALKRLDFSASAWRSHPRPENALAWWSSRVKDEATVEKKLKLAPNDALTAIFIALADKPNQAALRYALALLLARRRVLRFDYEENASYCAADSDERATNSIYVFSPRNETGYLVPIVPMTASQMDEVQRQLASLLEDPDAALELRDSETEKNERQVQEEPKPEERRDATEPTARAKGATKEKYVSKIDRETRLKALREAFKDESFEEEIAQASKEILGE